MPSSRGPILVCSTLFALLGWGIAGTAWRRGAVAPVEPGAFRPAPVARPPTPGVSRLSAAEMRTLASVEKTLRSGNTNGTEAFLWQTLPDLLSQGGAPLVNRLLAETPPGALRETLLRICEIEWPKVDPAAALAWTARLPEPAERREAYERVLSSLAGIDPSRAVQVASAREASGETNGALTAGLVAAWASTDLHAARRWTLTLPPGERRDACVARVTTVEACNFPADAARFALKRLPPGPVLDETLITTLYYWTGRNAAQAREWVNGFPAGPFRDRALAEVNGAAAVPADLSSVGQP